MTSARQVRTWALSRPFCVGGVALCRGTTTAISRYDHALVTSDDDLVSLQGCMHRSVAFPSATALAQPQRRGSRSHVQAAAAPWPPIWRTMTSSRSWSCGAVCQRHAQRHAPYPVLPSPLTLPGACAVHGHGALARKRAWPFPALCTPPLPAWGVKGTGRWPAQKSMALPHPLHSPLACLGGSRVRGDGLQFGSRQPGIRM